jgi:hypothetical protein
MQFSAAGSEEPMISPDLSQDDQHARGGKMATIGHKTHVTETGGLPGAIASITPKGYTCREGWQGVMTHNIESHYLDFQALSVG